MSVVNTQEDSGTLCVRIKFTAVPSRQISFDGPNARLLSAKFLNLGHFVDAAQEGQRITMFLALEFQSDIYCHKRYLQ